MKTHMLPIVTNARAGRKLSAKNRRRAEYTGDPPGWMVLAVYGTSAAIVAAFIAALILL